VLSASLEAATEVSWLHAPSTPVRPRPAAPASAPRKKSLLEVFMVDSPSSFLFRNALGSPDTMPAGAPKAGSKQKPACNCHHFNKNKATKQPKYKTGRLRDKTGHALIKETGNFPQIRICENYRKTQ
jgi:hypothetical protein